MKQSLALKKLPKWVTLPLMESIPFYKNVIQKDPDEVEFLLMHSAITEFAPGTVIIRKGERDSSIYSVLLGQLLAFFDHNTRNPVGYISRGEMFGEMAMVYDLERQATVVADSNSKKILLLETDFSSFGTLDDFSEISLRTKLLFLRSSVDLTRKRLVAFRVNFPDYNIAKRSISTKKFDGKKGTIEELEHLYESAKMLGQALNDWNTEVGNLYLDQNYSVPDTVETLTTLFDKHKRSA